MTLYDALVSYPLCVSLSRYRKLDNTMHFPPIRNPKRHDAHTDPIGHVIAMGTFGFAGYWAYQWDKRAAVLLAEKRAEIAERRAKAEGTPSS